MFTERELSHRVRLKLTLGFPQLKDVTGESMTIQTSGCKMAPMVWPLNPFTDIGGGRRRAERWTPRCQQWLALYSPPSQAFCTVCRWRSHAHYKHTKRSASCPLHRHCLHTVHTCTRECRAACVCKAYPAPPPLLCTRVMEKGPPLNPALPRKQPQRLLQAAYLANELQGVPRRVPRPHNCQGWLIIGQTEPGWSEIFMDPDVTVGIVLVDAG